MSGTPLPAHETPIEVLEQRVAERTVAAASAMQLVRIAIDKHTALCEELWQARRDVAERRRRTYNLDGIQDGLSSAEVDA